MNINVNENTEVVFKTSFGYVHGGEEETFKLKDLALSDEVISRLTEDELYDWIDEAHAEWVNSKIINDWDFIKMKEDF